VRSGDITRILDSSQGELLLRWEIVKKNTTSASRELRLRITVIDPPAGVLFRIQRGRASIEEPARETPRAISFDFAVRLGTPLASGQPNFLGEFTQGTPGERFVYINSGALAGDESSPWQRRAKVKLAGIDSRLLQQALKRGGVLEAQIAGTAKDGGAACATVPLLGGGWRLLSD
jgi:hypothetical protein